MMMAVLFVQMWLMAVTMQHNLIQDSGDTIRISASLAEESEETDKARAKSTQTQQRLQNLHHRNLMKKSTEQRPGNVSYLLTDRQKN